MRRDSNSMPSILLKRLLSKEVIRSKRNKGWFSLDKSEKSFCTLFLRLDIKMKSIELFRAVIMVIKKMRELYDNSYSLFVKGVGMAWLYSNAALSWGNKYAASWRYDRSFIIYLGKLGSV
ncbi:MAG: hypothetical protein QXQ39_06465 [Conexivisphaerales archaeon]